MKLLPLEMLGARVTSAREGAPRVVQLGVLLPWITPEDGYRLWVKVIHERDQFLQGVPPRMFELTHRKDPAFDAAYNDYWSAQISIEPEGQGGGKSAWGEPGTYVYRYFLERPGGEPIDWIIDPFAREFGVGKLSAFTLGYKDHAWSEGEAGWRTPRVDDLVAYEMMFQEFGGSIANATQKLDYLRDLGINCVEVMPVSHVANAVDWGFLPIGYFGVDDRFGTRQDLQAFVDEAHRRGIAVILDVVYGHTSDSFTYPQLYSKLGFADNPFTGRFARDYFGASTDFEKPLVQDFFFSVNHHLLETYHVDGFRYDCVPNYWEPGAAHGYVELVRETYRHAKVEASRGGHWRRFLGEGAVNLIQCAEQLEAPEQILKETFSNATWQNGTLGAAQAVARGDSGALTRLGFQLGLLGYPHEVEHDGDTVRKAPLQYIENHDHSRFVCAFRTLSPTLDEVLKEGDRSLWYKVQPYLIGLFTGKGIPMLWQGQELCENYFVPEAGVGRVLIYRPMRWDYFYDAYGQRMISLVRKLVRLRKAPQLRRGEHHFYNDPERYQDRGVLLFSRRLGDRFSLVALNFGDQHQSVPFTFPVSGDYREELHGLDDLRDVVAGAERVIAVPSNYGRIWTIGA